MQIMVQRYRPKANPEKSRRLILIADKLPPARDNIGQYTCHLAASLQEHGQSVEIWSLGSSQDETVPVPTRSFAQFHVNLSKLYHVARAIQCQGDCIILWQYNPFLYGWKGLPSLIYALPLVSKVLLRCRVG